MGRRTDREITRLTSSGERLEQRVETLRQEVNGLGSRLDERIDTVHRVQVEDSERLLNRLDRHANEVSDQIEEISSQVKDLTVKIGLEVGMMRPTVDAVATQKRVLRELLSADFLTRFRLIVLIVLIVLAALFGSHVESLVLHVLGL